MWNLDRQLEYTLQWEDARLWNHPCRGALQNILSLTREEARSDTQRSVKARIADQFFSVHLDADDLRPGFDGESAQEPLLDSLHTLLPSCLG